MAKADADGWETIAPGGEAAAKANADGWETIAPSKKPVAASADGWTTIVPALAQKEEKEEERPEAKTKNPLIGLVGRAASVSGAFVDSVAEVAERVGDKLELAVPLSGISEEDIKNKKQLQPLFDWAKSLKDFDKDLGYQPSTQLKELGSNPLNVIPFVAERVITSLPDMAAAVKLPVAYVMARTKEILDERVKNDEKTLDDATVGDVTAAVTAAVIESRLEAFATKGLFRPTAGVTKTGRVAKETGTQAGTEVLEEEAAYLGEAAGTKKGLSAEEALTRGAEAAIVGGGLGATVQGTKEVLGSKGKEELAIEKAAAEIDKLNKGTTTTVRPPESEGEAPTLETVPAEPTGKPDPERVAQLTDMFRAENVPFPEEAAIEEATKEAVEDKQNADAQRKAQGAADAVGPVGGPIGVGDGVAAQSDTERPSETVRVPDPTGMVSTRQDVSQPAVREGAEPTALTPGPASNLQTAIAEADDIATEQFKPVEEAIAELQTPKAEAAPEAATEPKKGKAPIVYERGAFIPSNEKGGDPVASAGFRTLDEDNNFDSNLAGATFITGMGASERNKGAGTKLLNSITDWADSNGKTLVLVPAASPDSALGGLSQEELKAWYARNGFEDRVDYMVRAPAEAAPEAPKKGRGRPKLTDEQRVANRAATKAAYKNKGKAAAAASSEVDSAITALDTALAPIDEAEISTEEQLKDAERQKRIGKIQAIKSLLKLQDSLSPTDTARGKIEAALKNSAISAKELADVKTGITYEKSKASSSEKTGKAGRPEAGFSKATNGAQALAQIIKTGDAFQKFIAKRIRGFVNGVNFVVLEKGDPVPEQLQPYLKEWNTSRGLFVENLATKTRTVYVRGVSFGADHGVDITTVLHELLHAATGQKLTLGLAAIAKGLSSDALLTKATQAFTRVMRNAGSAYEAMDRAGTVPDDLRTLVESTLYIGKNGQLRYKIFELEQEFLAYGMTEPAMQKFLMTVDATQAEGSLGNRFVRAIMEFFGVGNKDFSAMTDLVLITDKILSSRLTPAMRKLERVESGESYEKVFASAKQTREKVDKDVEKLKKSNFADAIKSGGPIEQLVGERNMNDFLEVMVKSGVWLKDGVMQQLLPALQTEAVVRWAGKLGVGGIKDTWAGINKMNAMRNKAKNAMFETAEELNNLAAKNAKQYTALGNIMHYSTIRSKDPNKVTTDRNLTALWNRLTPENKELYNKVREFYTNNHKSYYAVLEEQINASGLPGSASDPKSPKGKLIASIKQMYEDGTKLYPYFPLMRYGQYWVRVGKGLAREFQMFESQSDRDRFVEYRIKQLNAASGNTRTKAEMIAGGDIDEGNDLSSARKKDIAASEMLKEIFNTLESKPVTSITDDYGNVVSNMSTLNMDKLKDDIYQMYLQTLPDRNFRRQFMHRQGVAGFSGDIHRNFVATGTNMANQIARIKYGPAIMLSLENASESLKGNPNKARLGDFVSEMRLRAEQQIRPSSEDSLGFQLSNLANTTTFLWMMTSIKTVVAQFTAIPIFVVPVLVSKHGVVKTAAALTKSLNVFNGIGITKTNPDGTTSYTMPSTLQLEGLTADEKLAAQYMQDFGISDTTMAFDLGNRRDVPTKLGQSNVRRVGKVVSNSMSALFHHSERMIREVTFMTSYRLNRDKGKAGGLTDAEAHEAALEAATQESHEALGNYHASNRPRGIFASKSREVTIDASSPIGRSLLQFKMFPAFVTTYFIRNGYNMFAGLNPQERKEARIQFLGTLGMSYALAGYVGIPGISLAMGVAQAILNATKADDEDDPLEGRDLEFWVRNVWLPQTFGNVKVGDRTLDEFLDRGLIANLTGYDITSSMSMNNMWFPDGREQATTAAEMDDYALSLLGPSVSLFRQTGRAIDYFQQGKILQGFEQLAPAIFRDPLKAYRYSQEGAQTNSGDILRSAEEFTFGQLLAQSAGFATEGLQARREALFKVQGIVLEAKRERSAVLDRLDLELTKGSDRDVEKAFDKLINYNIKNYWDPIDNDQLGESLRKRIERRLLSNRGFPIDEKYFPQVMDLLEPSLTKIEREDKK